GGNKAQRSEPFRQGTPRRRAGTGLSKCHWRQALSETGSGPYLTAFVEISGLVPERKEQLHDVRVQRVERLLACQCTRGQVPELVVIDGQEVDREGDGAAVDETPAVVEELVARAEVQGLARERAQLLVPSAEIRLLRAREEILEKVGARLVVPPVLDRERPVVH